jgi:hypothetical protein
MSVVVGEGGGVVEDVGVGVDVGKEAERAVTVSITEVSIDDRMGVGLGVDTPR